MKPPLALAAAAVLALTGCSVMPPEDFPRAQSVDLDRFVGTWYVIAHIPPAITDDAYNSIEHYERTEGGDIKTIFTYREGGFEGERERMVMTGDVIEGSDNAVWAMKPFWPLRFENTIAYVGPNYETTIIARSARDYVWIMARQPKIADDVYSDLVERVEALGYDTSLLRRVPQQPLDERDDSP